MMEKMKVRKHIYFSGRVQGVGFRYRTYYIAQSLGLTGWVQNLWDGRVEAQVQGTERDVKKLISELDTQRFIRIEHIEIEDMELREKSGFEILN